MFFLLSLCPPLSRRERDILHDDRDAPRQKIVIILIRFHALKTHTAVKGGFIYTLLY